VFTVRSALQAGIKVAVLERSNSLRQTGAAIALQTNAFRALNMMGQGIADALRATHPKLTVWEYYTASGQLLKTLQVDQCSAGPHELRGVRARAPGFAREPALRLQHAKRAPPRACPRTLGVGLGLAYPCIG